MSLTNILQEKIAINIENVVATSSLNHPVNIKKILKQFPDSKYNPDKFPGAVIRISKPRSVILVFKSGSIVSTGTNSEESAHEAISRFVTKINRTEKMQELKIGDVKIENVVASCNIEKKFIWNRQQESSQEACMSLNSFQQSFTVYIIQKQ